MWLYAEYDNFARSVIVVSPDNSLRQSEGKIPPLTLPFKKSS